MGLKTRATSDNGGQDFPLAPDGQHLANCVAVVDLGTHTEQGFQGAEASDVHKLYIVWELSAEAGSPCIGKDFRVSLHPKSAFRAMLKAWRGGRDIPDGEEFDPSVLVGKPCQITVEHKKSQDGSRTYAKVAAVTGLAKGMTAPKQINPSWTFDLDVNTGPLSVPDHIPFLYGKPIEEVILTCHERAGQQPRQSAGIPPAAPAPAMAGATDDSTAPF